MKYRQKAEDTEYLKKRIAVSESYACEKWEPACGKWLHMHGRVDACVLYVTVSLTCLCVVPNCFVPPYSAPPPLTLLLFSPHFHSFLPFYSLIVYFFSSFLPPHFLPLVSLHFFLLPISFFMLFPNLPVSFILLFSPSSFSFLLPPGVEAAEWPDGGDEGSPGTEGHFTHGQGRECGWATGGAGIHQSATRISQSGNRCSCLVWKALQYLLLKLREETWPSRLESHILSSCVSWYCIWNTVLQTFH